jgi:hypothetical protein
MAGIYQSRAFNFINSQTNRVKNSLSQGWRQVKVSVKWTGQILLAPLRWLNRFSQNTERQIPGSARSQLLPEQPPSPVESSHSTAITRNTSKAIAKSASKAIETLLAEVAAAGYGLLPSAAFPLATHDDWSVIDENDWDTAFLDENKRFLTGESHSLLPQRPVIQGLATLLSNQHLVLIDEHNQVLDILSTSQQLHIRQRISPAIKQTLNPVTEELSASPAKYWQPVPPIVVLAPTPEQPHTILQKLGYWSKFYLEYFRVDIGSNVAPSQPLVLQPPLHKSLAVIPQSIAAISPEKENLSLSPPAVPYPQPLRSASIDNKITTVQSQVIFQPEWIDAPTENLGYERTLWQQLWNWLDQIMLRIEDWIISIYQQFKKAR